MTSRLRIFGGLSLVVVAAGAAFAWSSCGTDEINVLKPVAKTIALKSDTKAQLEEARVDLDKGSYQAALSILDSIINDSKKDSNEARVLYASAKLGTAGFGVWNIISGLISTTSSSGDATKAGGSGKSGGTSSGGTTGTSSTSTATSSSSSDTGLNALLNSITDSVLGTGDERTAHIQALYDTVEVLQKSPDPTDTNIENVSCIVAAFLAVPTLADATTAMSDMTTALTQISSTATNGGTSCPDIGLLDTASAALTTAAASFNYILQVAKNCSFMNLETTASEMNNIETALSTLTANVDKGCSALPSSCGTSCQSLFPTCVQEAFSVGASTAVAGDGVISACELVLNCTDPTQCFQSL